MVDAEGQIIFHVQGRIVALVEEERQPKVRWEYVTGARVPGPVVLGPDGNVRFHCSDGYLHCITTAGKQVWAPAMVGEPLGHAAPVADAAGNTWINAYDGGLIKVDPAGRIPSARFFRSRQRFNAGGILHDDVLLVGSEDGYLFAIDLGPGQRGNLWDHAAGQGATGWFINSTPALGADGVVVASGDDHLHGFALDGKPLWQTKMSGQMMGAPAIDRHGHVYVGVSVSQRGRQPCGFLVSVDGNSHKVRWECATGPIESTPVIGDDDILYVGDNSGTIHALDLRGNVQWTAKVESPVRSAGKILAPHRLAFGLDNETLVVLECASGGMA